jgi:aspartate/methionine/tyrosine aminotransferase
MRLAPVLLEEWMRLYYFSAEIDIGSSGVENFSIADLRRLLGFGLDEIDRLVLRDSDSLGGAGIRRALAERFLGGQVERVLVTHGSSEGIYLILSTLLSAGDEVVVLDPCYPQHFGIAEALGCRLVRWPLRFERGFRPDLDEMRDLVRPGTKMVLVNFPNNPTGATLRPDELDELVRRVEEVGALLVWDGAFTELSWWPRRRSTAATASSGCGASRRCATARSSPPGAPKQEGRIARVPPEGGVTAFARLPQVGDVEAFCHRLAHEEKVLLIPGACFGGPRHVRLGFGDATAAFEQGLGRLSRALSAVTA